MKASVVCFGFGGQNADILISSRLDMIHECVETKKPIKKTGLLIARPVVLSMRGGSGDGLLVTR